jgi:hypothetical protein
VLLLLLLAAAAAAQFGEGWRSSTLRSAACRCRPLALLHPLHPHAAAAFSSFSATNLFQPCPAYSFYGLNPQ